MAGMVSLVNAARRAKGKSTLGFLNPALYALHEQFANDITSGDNHCLAAGTGCCHLGFKAAEGWDPVTGLGSVNFEKFKRVMMDLVVDVQEVGADSGVDTSAGQEPPTETPPPEGMAAFVLCTGCAPSGLMRLFCAYTELLASTRRAVGVPWWGSALFWFVCGGAVTAMVLAYKAHSHNGYTSIQ
jgi:hypothetical protein